MVQCKYCELISSTNCYCRLKKSVFGVINDHDCDEMSKCDAFTMSDIPYVVYDLSRNIRRIDDKLKTLWDLNEIVTDHIRALNINGVDKLKEEQAGIKTDVFKIKHDIYTYKHEIIPNKLNDITSQYNVPVIASFCLSVVSMFIVLLIVGGVISV